MERNILEELLTTIESKAENNIATITNVSLFVDSWRKEALNLPVVSHRRELLFALLEWIDYGDGEDRESIVDRFSKDFEANNCG